MFCRALTALSLVASLAGPAAAAAGTTHAIHPNAACTPNPGTSSCRGTQLPTGGPMINTVKVFLVFYSPNYQYKDQLVDFYKAIVQSPHMDMLREYDGTSYKIRRGSYLGLYEDTNANPTTVKKVEPSTYIKGLVTAGKVPKPDANTLYMIYFPSGIDPTMNGGSSCISSLTYCAYHSYTSSGSGGSQILFGVMPDISAGKCSGGCGPAGFDGLTDVSGHEFVEALTDPQPNQNMTDNQCGEIGDVCATIAQDECTQEWDTVSSYKVQKEWSNELQDCVVQNPKYTLSDFSLSMPGSVMVPQGGTATVDVTLTKIGMTADTVSLKASGGPTDVTESFMPASVSSDNGKTTITLQASPTAMLGAGTFTINATGTTGGASHTQDVSFTVVPAPDMAMAQDLATPSGNGSGGNGSGGNGSHGGGSDSGCSMSGGGTAASVAPLFLLLAFVFVSRRRRA
jgi:MYXO-CTERM domain-containing protein